MIPDPNEPWGVALDYMGRAVEPVIEQGLSVTVWVADAEPNRLNSPTVNAQVVVMSPDWTMTAQLALVSLPAYSGTTWTPNPQLVQQAVEQAATQAIGHLQWLATLIPAP
ncbi:hypothetical protein ACFWIB_14820 [Streptomyces sp. NPDC127051]|uniref:hypothetical protein n=1 Tax=Streptomyces sp. NPDC127051 TaxID=3347119 RepID=UPI003667A734